MAQIDVKDNGVDINDLGSVLQSLAKIKNDNCSGRNLEQLVLSHGMQMTHTKKALKFNLEATPTNVPFDNAFNLFFSNPKYVYVEGFTCIRGLPYEHHAWVMDKRTGQIIDPTWGLDPTAQYIGIPVIRKAVMSHVMSRGHTPLFNNEALLDDFPVELRWRNNE